jgi:cytochrome c5
MPAQGGGDATDAEIANAVVFLVNAGGGKFTAPAAPAGGAIDAKALYEGACAACHTSGAAGAPKFGDKGAWSARVGQGLDGLTASAIKGKNGMPANGGTSYSEAEMKAVVGYMLDAVK